MDAYEKKSKKCKAAKAKLVAKYASKGVAIQAETYSRQDNKPCISQIFLDFTPEEWVDICYVEGELLGICCANISAVRDNLMGALRHGRWIDVKDLIDSYHLLKDHCGGDDWWGQDPDEDILAFTLNRIFNQLEEEDIYYRPTSLTLAPESLEDHIRVLDYGMQSLHHAFLFNDFKSKRKIGDIMHQLNRIVPSLNYVQAHIKEINPEPFEGYGMFLGDEITTMINGLALYDEKEVCDEIVEINNRDCEKDEDRYVCKKVRVSVEKGIEILE